MTDKERYQKLLKMANELQYHINDIQRACIPIPDYGALSIVNNIASTAHELRHHVAEMIEERHER